MPKLDGYDAVRAIRRMDGGSDTVIVALSASAFRSERPDALTSGFSEFLRKPFRFDDVYAIMRDTLGVKFRYESARITSAPVHHSTMSASVLAAALEGQPKEVLDTIRTALVECDVAAVKEAAALLRTRAPSLAEELSRCARDYRYDDFLALLPAVDGQEPAPRAHVPVTT